MTAVEVDRTGPVTPHSPVLAAALGYAAAGWHVFPVYIGAKSDGRKDVRYPVPWATASTTDPTQLAEWFTGRHAAAQLGLDCGRSDVFVVDIDTDRGKPGAATWAALIEQHGAPPATRAAATAGGGLHLYFRADGQRLKTGAGTLGTAVDTRGAGGMLILPPSADARGSWRWLTAPDHPLAPVPAWIVDMLAVAPPAPAAAPGVDLSAWAQFVASRAPQSGQAADRAISRELDAVSGAPAEVGAGFRTILMRAALILGGYVGADHLTHEDAEERLRAAVESCWGTVESDDEAWIHAGLTDGMKSPFRVLSAADALTGQYGAATPESADASAPGSPWTVYTAVGIAPFDPIAGDDQALAEATLARMRPALRAATDSGQWLIRGEHVWHERADATEWAVATLARVMPPGTTPIPKNPEDREPGHWQAVRRGTFVSSGGSGKVAKKMRALVVGDDHHCAVRVADLDAHAEVLWAAGVAHDLRTGLRAEVDPATPHLHTARYAPDPARPTPLFDAFLASVWPDPAVRAWALRVLSVAISGYADAALPILLGPARTGKTSLVMLVMDVLGSYAHAADPRLLGAADTAHASVIYALRGRRLSFVDEGPRRGHWAQERLKQLTGGGVLTGNQMRANPVTFSPTHTLVLTANDEPMLTDAALRARVRLLPCEGDPAEVRARRQALGDLRGSVWAQEAPGVLSRLMAECAGWLADRDSAQTSSAPESIRGIGEELAEAQDSVRMWISECTVEDTTGTQSSVLHRAYAAWYRDDPRLRGDAESLPGWSRAVAAAGYPSHRRQGSRFVPLRVPAGGGGNGHGPWTIPVVSDTSGGSDTGPVVQTNRPQGVDSFVTDLTPCVRSMSDPMSDDSWHLTQGETPRSAPVLSSSMSDLSDVVSTSSKKSILNQFSKENTKNLRKAEVSNHLTSEGGTPVSDVATESHPASARLLGSEPTSPQLSRTAAKAAKATAKAAAKAADKAAAVDTASGPAIGLPARQSRGGVPVAVTNGEALAVVRAALERSGALTVDVETSGYPIGHPDYVLRTIQLGDALDVVVFDAGDSDQAALAGELVSGAPVLCAHSATADLAPLAHVGLIDYAEAWSRMRDTVVLAKLGDPQITGSDPGLKAVAPAALGGVAVTPESDAARSALFSAAGWKTDVVATDPVARSGWAQVRSGDETMVRYAGADVLDTAALALALPHLYQVDEAVIERERRVQRITAPSAFVGFALDTDQVSRLTAEHEAGAAEVAAVLAGEGIVNPGSPMQVAAALVQRGAVLPLTATGKPSSASEAIEPLSRSEGPGAALAGRVLTWRHHDTALKLLLRPWSIAVTAGDGRVRPTVYTLGAATGRMSCVRPNLQQVSKTGGLRECITADQGHLLVSADFAGVELRVAAALSGDAQLRELILTGGDLHQMIADMVWGAGASKSQRSAAKRLVFGRLYGGGVATLSAQTGITTEQGAAVVAALDTLTPGLSAWSEHVRQSVRQGATQFPSYSGRVIHLDRDRPHAAPNYLIQGSARELLVDALIRWDDGPYRGGVILPVHDEIIAGVRAEDAAAAQAYLEECMTTELYGIPITVEGDPPTFAWQSAS